MRPPAAYRWPDSVLRTSSVTSALGTVHFHKLCISIIGVHGLSGCEIAHTHVVGLLTSVRPATAGRLPAHRSPALAAQSGASIVAVRSPCVPLRRVAASG